MNEEAMMSTKSQSFGAWSAVAFLVFLGIGFVALCQFVPPVSPLLGGEEISAFYQNRLLAIRSGLIFYLISSVFIVPFAAIITVQMRQFEGKFAVLSLTQFGCGVIGAVMAILPGLFWMVATFRLDGNPEISQMLNDFAWLTAVMPFPPVSMQCLAIGLAILWSPTPSLAYPRWVAYFNFWVAFLLMPGALAVFFKQGPFAWNGLLAFWLPASVFGSWFLVMFYVVKQGLSKCEA
jgi:hypothetical protein